MVRCLGLGLLAALSLVAVVTANLGVRRQLLGGRVQALFQASPRTMVLCDPAIDGSDRCGQSAKVCSAQGENCMETGCCQWGGMQCYAKDDWFATCKPECRPGPDMDDSEGKHWTCKEIGNRTPGDIMVINWTKKEIPDWVNAECAEPGEDCSQKKCCKWMGEQCYEKADGWSVCQPGCVPGGPNLEDLTPTPWNCLKIGPRTPGKPREVDEIADWVETTCSKQGESCQETRCCASHGMQCFAKNQSFAMCKSTCIPGAPDINFVTGGAWNCTALGPRTPGRPLKPSGWLPTWVKKECAGDAEDCSDSRCCKDPNVQCFQKSEFWSTCLHHCMPGEPQPHDETNETWSCKILGPMWTATTTTTTTTWSLGHPSLYCITVMRKVGDERDVMEGQWKHKLGVFLCDARDIFCSSRVTIGAGHESVEAITFEDAPVTISEDNTAGNTALFQNVWEKVNALGTWQSYDWTLKVDPDAVIFPDRLRYKLRKNGAEAHFIRNCRKSPAAMFGSVEAFSRKAIELYFDGKANCDSNLHWASWGEDLYMTRCMDYLGVQGVNDYWFVGDNRCDYTHDCDTKEVAAFHPRKSWASWHGCWEKSTGITFWD